MKENQKHVTKILKSFLQHEKDRYFLLYDLDVPEMLEKLKSIKNVILLVSNPCIELWYILHTVNHTAEITSQQCNEKLERICSNYKKGSICTKLRNDLTAGEEKAIARARKQTLHINPSTSVYLLLEELKKV